MRDSLRLARLLLAAERLRWRLALRRNAARGVILLAGAIFLIAGLAMAHAIAYLALVPPLPPIGAAAILLGADLLLAVILVAIALRMGPSRSERDALALRNSARAQLESRAAILRTAATLLALIRRR
jgi:hypothetical protein